jgi:hypothetical protein
MGRGHLPSYSSVTKVAILGGNGQVGTETAIYLSTLVGVAVVCLIRSEYSAALLRLVGVDYRVVDYSDISMLQQALSDCDVVADFRYPSGELVDILKESKKNIAAAIGSMKTGSRYVFMSSIMAFGMPDGASKVREHSVPRTSYSYIKRESERFALKMGKRAGMPVFLFRLGQVHGVLQGVSQEYVVAFSTGRVRVNGAPGDPSITVFACSVGEALLRCTKDLVPGLYTVVCSPQWTLAELHSYYQIRYKVKASVEYAPVQPKSSIRCGLMSLVGALRSGLMSQRGLLETYILLPFPVLFREFKGRYRVARARIEATGSPLNRATIIHSLLGRVPGETVKGIPASLDEVVAVEQRLERIIDAAIRRGEK